jgi:hypothetical protein
LSLVGRMSVKKVKFMLKISLRGPNVARGPYVALSRYRGLGFFHKLCKSLRGDEIKGYYNSIKILKI